MIYPDRDNMTASVKITSPAELGAALREARRSRGLRLQDAAAGAGVGVRFLSELERGKPTSRLGETLRVASSLGLRLWIEDPDGRPHA
jgi:transcriptional regulator with XRE-family HTH domain